MSTKQKTQLINSILSRIGSYVNEHGDIPANLKALRDMIVQNQLSYTLPQIEYLSKRADDMIEELQGHVRPQQSNSEAEGDGKKKKPLNSKMKEWVDLVKKTQQEEHCSYKDAMVLAKEKWRK